jgi:hypothetical protein
MSVMLYYVICDNLPRNPNLAGGFGMRHDKTRPY